MAKDPARILIIEDSESDLFVFRYALEQQTEDYQLQVLRDGEDALRFIGEQRIGGAKLEPCVIVLDLHLPKHDGTAVLRAIKEAPALSHIHVVALTSMASPHDEAEVLALGVRLYRVKPTELDAWFTLAAEILEVCREPALA
jgi:CheY-like chemotaxis protein